MAITINLVFAQGINQKYSYGDFMHLSFKDRPASEFNNTIIIGSCFYQVASEDAKALREIEKNIFPVGMHGVTFRRCNLDNVFIPGGNTIEECSHRKIKVQNDLEDWILGEDLKPMEPMDKEERILFGVSHKPEDLPGVKFTPEQREEFEKPFKEAPSLKGKSEAGFINPILAFIIASVGIVIALIFRKKKRSGTKGFISILGLVFALLFLFPSVCLSTIGTSCVWEIRTTGSMNNGGGYTSGGTDYSQQDAAQLNNADFATSGIGVTTLTSVAGGFTAAMVGNIIHLTAGVNLLESWYEITVYTNGNTVTLDRAPDDGVGGVSGATGYVGGATALGTVLDDDFFEQLSDGNKVWIKAGTHTIGENVSLGNDGTAALPLKIEGYNSARDDWPLGNDRPLIAAAGNDWSFDNYWIIKNLRVTITDFYGFAIDDGGIIVNCASYNSGGGREAFNIVSPNWNATAIGLDAKSDGGEGIFAGPGTGVFYSYIHDSTYGIKTDDKDHPIIMNIIDTCSNTGIYLNGGWSYVGDRVLSNTIYNCGKGIHAVGNDSGSSFYNNIITGCTTGAEWDANEYQNIWDYNNWYDNTADVVNITKGPHALALDPQFTDAPNANFTIGTNLKAQGFPGQFPGAHASCDSYLDTGAVQREEAGGAAATHSYGFVQ